MPTGSPIPPEEVDEIKRKIIWIITNSPLMKITGACLAMKSRASRTLIYEWLKDDPEFRRGVDEALLASEDMALDVCEGQIMDKILKGNDKMIRYFMDRKGGNRGYNPKITTSLVGPDGLPLPPQEPPQFTVVFPESIDLPTSESVGNGES